MKTIEDFRKDKKIKKISENIVNEIFTWLNDACAGYSSRGLRNYKENIRIKSLKIETERDN